MTAPVPRPADAPVEAPLTRELAAQRHRVVFTGDGGEPALALVDGQLRAYALTARTAGAEAIELRFGATVERRPFLTEGLDVAHGAAVRIVPLHAQGEREWFSVIEAATTADAPWRVRLLERSGGRGKLLASHDSYGHRSGSQIRYPYPENGEVAIVRLGASLYAVAHGRVLVLDGPGADGPRLMETSDPDCPPHKRCYPLPAEVDVKRLLGHAPDGRSFVVAGEGDVHRTDAVTGAVRSFRYENFFYTGLVEDDSVVLAHAGEPPFVKRWRPAGARPAPPLLPGERGPTRAEVPLGDAQLLVEGPIYVQLASTTRGDLYGVTREGSLDRIADGRATPVVKLPAGHRVVSVAAADSPAFVVASDTTPPVHSIVIADR